MVRPAIRQAHGLVGGLFFFSDSVEDISVVRPAGFEPTTPSSAS